jgi:hypothetical protein
VNPFALTAEERAGAMMEPSAPGAGTFMDNIGALRAMVAPRQRYGNGAWLDESTAGTVTVGEGGAGVIRRARSYIAEESGKTYGAILPLKKDDATGDLSLAIPGFARDSATGILDMLEGHMTPEASMALLDIPIGGLLHAGVTGARQTPETLAAIRAYHGSPHRFDKFSLDKIGTGEGAQAYGHGLYFAEHPNVAKDYKTKLSDTTLEPRYIYKGKEYSRGDPEWKILGTLKNSGVGEVRRLLSQYAKDEAAGASYIAKDDKMRENIRLMRNFVADGIPKKGDISTTSGALYTTKLNVEPDDLLDYDAPLAKQPAAVRRALGLEEAANLESVPNSVARDANALRDLTESAAFRSEGFGGLDVPTQTKMLAHMFGATQNPQVLDAVVKLIPVDVMNVLRTEKLTPEMLFHDKSVLAHWLAGPASDKGIAARIDMATALAKAVAQATAEKAPGVTRGAGLSQKGSVAGETVNSLVHKGIIEPLGQDATGADVYRALSKAFETDDAAWRWLGKTPHDVKSINDAASQALGKLGIPGIRYLDQGSRGAGDGTRNFVIFDDKLIDIEAVQ